MENQECKLFARAFETENPPTAPVELTEKILMEAGGWQAMKSAKALYEANRVINGEWREPILSGVVAEQGTQFRAGLTIKSPTQIENTCSCKESRQWGMICPHSLAVGLFVIRGLTSTTNTAQTFSTVTSQSELPVFSANNGESIQLHVVLPLRFEDAWKRDSITVGFEVTRASKRCLLSALNTSFVFRCSPEDLSLLSVLKRVTNGGYPGIAFFSRDQLSDLLLSLKKHPRVTLGKDTPANVVQLIEDLHLAPDERTTTFGTHGDEGEAAEILELLLSVEGSLQSLSATLRAKYQFGIFCVTGDVRSGFDRRNQAAETKAAERLNRHSFAGPNAQGDFALKGERLILRFLGGELPKLQREWKVTLGGRFSSVSGQVERITPKVEMRGSGTDWFEVGITFSSSAGETFSSVEIQRLLQTGQGHVRLRNGQLAVFDADLIDELSQALTDCNPQQTSPGTYRVKNIHAGFLDATFSDNLAFIGGASWATAQRNLEAINPIGLAGLEETLRPYQKQGVYWMNFLAENGFSGLLADEMGLGKTVQALAFLAHRVRSGGGAALVVCPSSLIFNWLREASRWTPELKTLVIEGARRKPLFAQVEKADLIITSYPLLRRDIEKYQPFEFETVILDEAQHIKNPETQNAQSAAMLRSHCRFVLTGTPMENSVRDLWSILTFLMPGYLGSRTEFRERYELPIAGGDASAHQRLSKRLRPFLLRRRKKDVCAELPDKLEQLVLCQLNAQQKSVYDSILKQARQTIDKAASQKNEGKARMLMLTALLRLRQVCCDLRLLNLPDAHGNLEPSGKMSAFYELLLEAIDGGHRVLVFSQFVSMLSLLKERLEENEIAFSYLDGSTRNRAEVVDGFQTGSDPVFLISLKAGGVGLNLNAADTVIHFDPWWNPAVEAQATDRAHRIGQTRVVTSYKLISEGTIEEKILNLQQTKRRMISATVEAEEAFMAALTLSEIESLIR